MENNKITFAEIIERMKERRKEVMANTNEKKISFLSLLFAEWKVGMEYKAGAIVRVENDLYKVIEDHTSEEGMTPDVCSEKYKKIEKNGTLK